MNKEENFKDLCTRINGDIKVERLVEENIHYDPLFAVIGITNSTLEYKNF